MVDTGKGGWAFLPLVGRRDEVRSLTRRIRQRRSCLVSGPPGIGKSRLIDEALLEAGQSSVRASRPKTLHALLAEIAAGLRLRVGAHSTSGALKAAVLESLQEGPRCVVLEDVADADPRMYRFLQRVYYISGTSLIVAARSRESLGHLHKLLWDPREEIALAPLNRADSAALFEAACGAFGLRDLDLDGFRAKVLASAKGNPGQIVAMCRLASRPEYQHGRHIRFAPVRIDSMTGFLS